MNLKNLNVGIANLVENNGRLELEIHESRQATENYRGWWEAANIEKDKLQKELLSTQQDFLKSIELADNMNKKDQDLLHHFEALKSKGEKEQKIDLDYVIKKLSCYVKKDA